MPASFTSLKAVDRGTDWPSYQLESAMRSISVMVPCVLYEPI